MSVKFIVWQTVVSLQCCKTGCSFIKTTVREAEFIKFMVQHAVVCEVHSLTDCRLLHFLLQLKWKPKVRDRTVRLWVICISDDLMETNFKGDRFPEQSQETHMKFTMVTDLSPVLSVIHKLQPQITALELKYTAWDDIKTSVKTLFSDFSHVKTCFSVIWHTQTGNCFLSWIKKGHY